MKKILTFLAVFAIAMALCLQPAFAYIDPSAVSYLVMAISAASVAIASGVVFYFRRLKRALSKKKNADDDDYDEDEDDEDDE